MAFYALHIMRAFGGISVAHCVAANFCFMALTFGNRQLCNVAAPFPTKSCCAIFCGSPLKVYLAPHYAFGGISVAHYTYFISCVRPFREVAGINLVDGLQLNTAFLSI